MPQMHMKRPHAPLHWWPLIISASIILQLWRKLCLKPPLYRHSHGPWTPVRIHIWERPSAVCRCILTIFNRLWIFLSSRLCFPISQLALGIKRCSTYRSLAAWITSQVVCCLHLFHIVIYSYFFICINHPDLSTWTCSFRYSVCGMYWCKFDQTSCSLIKEFYCVVKDDEKKKVSVINEQLNDKKKFVVYSPFVLLYSYVIHRQPLHKHRFTSNILWVFPPVLLYCLRCVTNPNLYRFFILFDSGAAIDDPFSFLQRY